MYVMNISTKFFVSVAGAIVLACAVSLSAGAQNKKTDWAQFYRYQEANESVHRSNAKVKAVLMGDSITDNWLKFDKEWFEANNIQGRGISGQVTSQMLVRFQEDVVKLNPTYVAILAGTNDIARNNGEISLEHIMDNIKSMCEIARANKIKVVLCSVLPASRYSWRPELSPAEDIKALNAMICAFAKANKFIYVDYWSLLANEQGGLNPENAADGVHPNLETYKLMEQALMKVLK